MSVRIYIFTCTSIFLRLFRILLLFIHFIYLPNHLLIWLLNVIHITSDDIACIWRQLWGFIHILKFKLSLFFLFYIALLPSWFRTGFWPFLLLCWLLLSSYIIVLGIVPIFIYKSLLIRKWFHFSSANDFWVGTNSSVLPRVSRKSMVTWNL